MERILFVGFKGKNNASGKLVELISHEHLLLTNSFGGLQKDIYEINFKNNLKSDIILPLAGWSGDNPIDEDRLNLLFGKYLK
jgi:hypothetical protein